MSLSGFIFGAFIMLVSFSMVARTNVWIQMFGDLGEVFGIQNASWASWKVVGVIGMLIGFIVAFGLLQLFLQQTVGQFIMSDT